MTPRLRAGLVEQLEVLALPEWAELLYHAAELLHGLDRDASCYAHRASACITQALAERRRAVSVTTEPPARKRLAAVRPPVAP